MDIRAPRRVRRSYTQHFDVPPERIFPLLCPVREVDWAVGWEPTLVLSHSGLAEPDCVFVTPAEPSDAIWVITRHEPASRGVEMWKITPGHTACKLEIQLTAEGDRGTAAEVAYTHTSLGPEGDRFLEGFTEDRYREFMEAWERELNHYLVTGNRLDAG